jgi:hypothetical protein
MKKPDLPAWRIDNVFSFGISIITSVFAFAALYFSVVGDIRLIKQDISYIKESLTAHIYQSEIRDVKIANLTNRVTIIETTLGLKINDQSAVLK